MKQVKIRKPEWLPGFRSMVRCYQLHNRVAEEHFRQMGLTGAQFDILATLGNTEGMTCRELGEQTLITKGTLTGVIDRLIEKGWVIREVCETDRRVVYIRLTAEGEEMFEKTFQPHLDHMSKIFESSDLRVWQQLQHACEHVSAHLQKGGTPAKTSPSTVTASDHTQCGCDGEGI